MTKIVSSLEKRTQLPEHYENTVKLLSGIEKYVIDLTVDFPCDLIYNKLNISSVLKAVGIEIADDSGSLAEKILNYMELVREFEGDKLFITVNLRMFIEDGEARPFLESVLMHKYNLLMLEGTSHAVLPEEKRYTVDNDLCCF